MSLQNLLIKMQHKGYRIQYFENLSLLTCIIQHKDNRHFIGRCEIEVTKRMEAKEEIKQKIIEELQY